jgi:hypothetical protein
MMGKKDSRKEPMNSWIPKLRKKLKKHRSCNLSKNQASLRRKLLSKSLQRR